MTTCSHTGCGAEAKWAPKINVPATGWPIDMHRPISAIMMTTLCDAHFDGAIDIRESMKMDQFRAIFEIAAAGKQPPDFDRAFVSKVSLNSPEYLAFEKARARGEQ